MALTVPKDRLTGWKERWTRISSERFRNDYAVAELAHEIRAEFPQGDAGDLQFRTFVKRHLGGCSSKTLLEKARACASYTADEWHRLGGWQGISFLLALPTKQRRHVLETLHGAGPFHYSTLRTRAIKIGITSKRKGRDTRSQSEERVAVLRMFIADLYKKRKDMPEMPPNVRWAMSATLLTSIAHDLRA